MTDADLIAATTDTPPDGPAVYFLMFNGEVVYIGFSVRPEVRVKAHRGRGRRRFDRSLDLPTDEVRGPRVEREWIGRLRPRHNRRDNPRPDVTAENWGKQDDLSRVAIYPHDGTCLALAAKSAGLTQAEFFERHLRKIVHARMAEFGIDPAKAANRS